MGTKPTARAKALDKLTHGEVIEKMTLARPAQASKADRRRTAAATALRIQRQRFESWQRKSPPSTAVLVRLIRLLAR